MFNPRKHVTDCHAFLHERRIWQKVSSLTKVNLLLDILRVGGY